MENTFIRVAKRQHFYRPFKNSSIVFLVDTLLTSNEDLVLEIDDIDMYHQPVQHPVVALLFFCVKLIVIIIGEFVNARLLKNLKKENGLLTQVTRLLVWSQMISYPIGLVFITSTDFIHPVYEVFGYWFCTLGWFITTFFGYISLFHSFISAIMRYVYMLHNSKVHSYGKEKVLNLFLFLSICIPLLFVIWETMEEFSVFSYINKCYGRDHKVFLIETSTLDVLTHKFWSFSEFKSNGILDTIIVIVQRLSNILKAILFLIMGCNIIEGFIYYRIFAHIIRYNHRNNKFT